MKKKIDTESLIIWLDNQRYIIPDDIEWLVSDLK